MTTRRLVVAAVVLAAVFCAGFVVVDAVGVELLRDPSPWLRKQGAAPALVGVALLIADVLLPVPSSIVMIAHGAAYGLPVGAALSVTGTLGATWLGLALGRRGGRWLAPRGGEEHGDARAARMLERWGPLAIALSRPIPVVAETTAILAGASGVRWGAATLAATAGAVPPAIVYAWAGAHATEPAGGALIAAGVVVLAGALWLAGWRLSRGSRSGGASGGAE
jgi:uncharacterized membrane protein YdjX (TVP38/TMEM64 family)